MLKRNILPDHLTALESELLNKKTQIECWLQHEWNSHSPPFYGSVDLRNAGYKIGPIDMNLFPGGFNNLNHSFLTDAVIAMQKAVHKVCQAKSVLIIPENHTRNTFYLENVYSLQQILLKAGFETRIGTLVSEHAGVLKIQNNHKITLEAIKRKDNRLYLQDSFSPCIILLNNDLSAGIPDILQGLQQNITPPLFAGWTTRRKSQHFFWYQKIIQRLSKTIALDGWLINPYYEVHKNLDLSEVTVLTQLSDKAAYLLSKISEKYREYGIKDKAFLIMKANAGTYGMGVMTVRSPNDILQLNRKARNKMSTTKEGLPIQDVILQEGIYTYEQINGGVAEPVVYMVDQFVVGGFYRIHEGRGNDENLNASGMQFTPIKSDVSTVQHDEQDKQHHFTCWQQPALPSDQLRSDDKENRFYIYGLIARLSLLAAALEIEHTCAQ